MTASPAKSKAAYSEREGVLHFDAPFPLHHGSELPAVSFAWRLAGRTDGPVVLVLGGISASRRVFTREGGKEGWWNEVVGPGRALDSDRYALLGIDFLGGSGDSSGPTTDSYPPLSSFDQARAIEALLDHLGIPRLRAIVGASYGAMVALAFGQLAPSRVDRLIVISGADVTHPMATAWRCVQRSVVRFSLKSGSPADGMELARALAMSTYRSPEEFAARFRAQPRFDGTRAVFPVEEYLFARGRDYAARYRPESFICLSESIDLHAVDATRIPVPTEVVAVKEDQLVPIADMRALAARLPDARFHALSSLHGHDAFLKEADQLRPILATLESGDRS
ncbi:MAG: homoserine O-succinyltransferase [Steroidobacteraceae bacterium]